MLQRSRPDEVAENRDCRDRFGISDRQFVNLFTRFNAVGYWRCELDTGHIYFCDRLCEVFGIEPTDRPVNLMEVTSRIHPDDLGTVMEIHEASSVRPMSYQKIHRVSADGKVYHWYCCIGDFREKAGSSGEVAGIYFALPPTRCEFQYSPADERAAD